MTLHNLRIRTRLALGFAAVLLLAMISSGIGIWRLNEVAAATRGMMQEPLTKERMTEEWYHLTFAGLKRQLAIVKSADPSLATYFVNDAKSSSARITEIQKYIEAHLNTPREKELFEIVGAARKRYLANRDHVMLAKQQGKEDEVAKLFEEFIPLADQYRAAEQEFLAYQKESVNSLSQAVDATASSSRRLVCAFIVLTILLGGLFAWSLTISITRPINSALQLAQKVADGDLTSRIQAGANDEAGQLTRALMEMTAGLTGMVAGVRRDADAIAATSSQLANDNQDLAARTEQQADSLEKTSSAMEELTSTVRQNAEHARQANGLAVSASEIASRGGDVVARVVGTMGAINESSRKIVDIIGVIDGIAFQTNILALNAAVEAARAGEQGRGFAVVASEVRTLAQRSAAAAKEIKGLIDSSVEQVDLGSKLVDQAGATMGEIVTGIQRVTDIMNEITVASDEQQAGIEQVNQAIVQMDQVTQQNAALVQDAATAAASLQEQAGSLVQAVSAFKLETGVERRGGTSLVPGHVRLGRA